MLGAKDNQWLRLPHDHQEPLYSLARLSRCTCLKIAVSSPMPVPDSLVETLPMNRLNGRDHPDSIQCADEPKYLYLAKPIQTSRVHTRSPATLLNLNLITFSTNLSKLKLVNLMPGSLHSFALLHHIIEFPANYEYPKA